MKHWSRRIALGLLALAIIAALAYGFRPQPIAVDVARAVRGDLRVTVDEEGRTRVIDRYVISAPVAAYTRRIALDVGDAVQQGEALLILEPLRSTVLDPRSRAAAEARVKAAEASYQAAREEAAAAEAAADFAAAEHRRIERLREAKQVSEEQLDRARAEARRAAAVLRAARFTVDVAGHELEAARAALKYSAAQQTGELPERIEVRSPADGRVLGIHRESEGVVEAGQVLIEVGNPRVLEVEVDVLSKDAVRIGPGTRVMFERWGGDEPLEGVVRTVEPVGFTKISALGVEEQRVNVIADITSPPERWQRLGHGYRVEASFVLWEGGDILQVPASSLFRYRDGWALFGVEGGRAVLHAVEVGHRNGLRAHILSGVDEGDTVIVHPDDALEDGARVEVRS